MNYLTMIIYKTKTMLYSPFMMTQKEPLKLLKLPLILEILVEVGNKSSNNKLTV